MYRALMARGIYLSQDRAYFQVTVNELSRIMSKPRGINWEALKRFGRYLIGQERPMIE